MRNLLYPKHVFRKAATCQVPLRLQPLGIQHALIGFERANRGHRHELDDHKMSSYFACKCKNGTGCQGCSRQATLRKTSQALFDSVMRLDTLPDMVGFNVLLDSPDYLGWFERFAREHLKRLEESMLVRLSKQVTAVRCDVHITLHGADQNKKSDEPPLLHLSVHLQRSYRAATPGLRGRVVRASRMVNLPLNNFQTLRSAWQQFRVATQELEALIDTVLAWPEFAQQAAIQRQQNRLEGDLEQLCKKYSSAELDHLRYLWVKLLPPLAANTQS
jgi:hypothetical protein